MRIKSLRALIPPPLRVYPEAKSCSIEGCKQTPWEGKLYCYDHVERHPYVIDLLQRMSDRVKEDDYVKRNGSKVVNVDEPGITLKDILQLLKQNKIRTEERLEQDLRLPGNLIHNYCVALQKRGIVKIKMKPCGRQQVTFLGMGEDNKSG